LYPPRGNGKKGGAAAYASLFASLVEKYEAAGARYIVVDMRFHGLMSNDVQKYLDDAHERLTMAEGFAVWRL
jgi:hypothetical protein